MMKLFLKKHISCLLAFLSLMPVISFASLISGTTVETPGGPKAIDTLRVGDTVLTYSEDTNQIESQPITFLFTGIANDVMRIKVVNADQQVNSIDITQEHPVYVGRAHSTGKLEYQWRQAKSLKAGDALLTYSSVPVYVVKIKEGMLSQRVFNIEVARQHNYFASEYKILLHNPGDIKLLMSADCDAQYFEVPDVYTIERTPFLDDKFRPSLKGDMAVLHFNGFDGGGIEGEEDIFFSSILSADQYKALMDNLINSNIRKGFLGSGRRQSLLMRNDPSPETLYLARRQIMIEQNRPVEIEDLEPTDIQDKIFAVLENNPNCSGICLSGLNDDYDTALDWIPQFSSVLRQRTGKDVLLSYSAKPILRTHYTSTVKSNPTPVHSELTLGDFSNYINGQEVLPYYDQIKIKYGTGGVWW